MALPAILGGIAAIGTAGVTAWNAWQQKKQQDWQKKAQQITWEREDTAQQRAVKDLRAAGLSPTLAAGAGAPTSSPTKPEAPQIKQTPADIAAITLNLLQMKANIAKTAAEARSQTVLAQVNEQTSDALANIRFTEWRRSANLANIAAHDQATARQRTNLMETTAESKKYDLERSRKFGLRTTDHSPWAVGAQMGDQGINVLLDILEKANGVQP